MQLEKLILPEEIEQRLKKRSLLHDETVGYLICWKEHNRYIASTILETAKGSPGTVEPRMEGDLAIQEFLNDWIDPKSRLTESSNYVPVEYHTHTPKTIEIFGDFYKRHFSKGDRKGIGKRTKQFHDLKEKNPITFGHYIHLLVTPERFYAVRSKLEANLVRLPVKIIKIRDFDQLEAEAITAIRPFLKRLGIIPANVMMNYPSGYL